MRGEGDHMENTINPKQAGGGGIRPQTGFSPCCVEMVGISKLKICDFHYILITFHFKYKPVTWDIHYFQDNAIVGECLVQFWLKSVENCNLFARIIF